MGGSYWSPEDYNRKVKDRLDSGAATFAYDQEIKEGKRVAAVHSTLDPYGVKLRESRDSEAHPITLPIAVWLDTTGSMARVPLIIQAKLPSLLDRLTEKKPSGKSYLGDAYPAIMIGAIDDWKAQGKGALQVGQFESGIEIEDNLTNLWLTKNGGGSGEEDYHMAMYFMARHTVHDHWEKRRRKGYMFLIGDERTYPVIRTGALADLMGITASSNIETGQVLAEAKERYEIFFVIPGGTAHYDDDRLKSYWAEMLGPDNVLYLNDPNLICPLIVTTVALREKTVGVSVLTDDGVWTPELATTFRGMRFED